MIRCFFRKKIQNSLRYAKEKDLSTQPKETKLSKKNGFFSPQINQLKKDIIKQQRELKLFDLVKNDIDLEEVVDLKYKEYPSDIDHWNPKSKNYIHDTREEKRMESSIKNYNEIIDNFKKDLQSQKEILDYIQKMDRPYLKQERGFHRNVYDNVKNYSIPVEDGEIDRANKELSNLDNEKMVINNTPFHVKIKNPSNILEIEKIKKEAPINFHYNHDKGSKFDVTIPYENRQPHVADRLGHPEIFMKPLESLLRLDKLITHPTFLDQPFIQTPKAEPNNDVDFSAGEVIYENPQMKEWTLFGTYNALASNLFVAGWYAHWTFNVQSTFENYIYEEYQMIPFDHNIFQIDGLGMFPVLNVALVLSALVAAQNLFNLFAKSFVHKVQYNSKKDLLFVETVGAFGGLSQKIYEVDHLDLQIPFVKTGTKMMDFSDQGFTRVSCLNSIDTLVFQNNPKYWRKGEKDQFFSRINRFFDKSYVEEGFYGAQVNFIQNSFLKITIFYILFYKIEFFIFNFLLFFVLFGFKRQFQILFYFFYIIFYFHSFLFLNFLHSI